MNKWEKIESIVNQMAHSLDDASRNELLQQISIYHEELVIQNDELRRINQELEDVKNDYRELFRFAPIVYFIVNSKGTIVEANQNSEKIFGRVLKENITKYIEFDCHGYFYVFFKKLISDGESMGNFVFINRDSSIHMEVIGNRAAAKKNHFLIACVNFEKQYKTMQEINDLSYKDHLTDLYNRRYFEKKVRLMNPQKDLPFSVIIADVNGLKILNDSFGHAEGDELLKKSAQLISGIIGDGFVISRIGGDEFAVLLPNTDRKDCRHLMEKMNEACSGLRVNGVKVSLSFGMETMTSIREDLDSVIANAEEEMYRNKLLHEVENNAEIVESIFDLLCEQSPREEENSKLVSEYMKKFGEYLSYDKERIELMSLAGLLHNIGKVAIDPVILEKKIDLTACEHSDVKKNPEISYRILKSSSKFSKVAHIILYSHEWINGKGYPKGLMGEFIPFESKVLSVCIAFSVMTSEQPYRAAMTKEDAIAELESLAGTQFDTNIVRNFVKMINETNSE